MATHKNIIVGAASVFYNDDPEEDRPAYVTSTSYRTTMAGSAATTAGWTDVGYTQDGVEYAYEPDFGEVEVDQVLDAAKLFKQSMTVSLNTTFAEATLENLLIVWAQSPDSLHSGAYAFTNTTGTGPTTDPTSAAGDSVLGVEAGSLGEAPFERQLVVIGNGVEKTTGSNNYSERVYHARRVLSVESSTHGLKRAEATVFPVSFRLLPDARFSGAEYGTLTERLKS